MLKQFAPCSTLLFFLFVNPVFADTIIHAGKLIDGADGKVHEKKSIIVKSGMIVDVVNGYKNANDGDSIIDLTEHTVMPGLMDMHTHLMMQHHKKSLLR